jgi:hypothetical protein
MGASSTPSTPPPAQAATVPPQPPVERDGDGDTIAAASPTRVDAVELDLAFCCDCTGSMGAYIRSAQDNIRTIAQRIGDRKGETCSIRYALVKYRDHPPQDTSFITEVYPFTKSLDVMKANVDTMVASGGGDGPEAVTAGLHEVNELNWRPNATKVCVFIADAPPHGLGEDGDGFPNGSPDGRDPIQITRDLASKGITVYTVGVEPILSTSYKFARDFFMMVAQVTEGKFLPLGKAEILADVIVSSSIEGIELTNLWGNLEAEIAAEAKSKNEAISEEELIGRVEKRMAERAKDVVMEQVEVVNPYMDARYDQKNCHAFSNATSLSSARAQLDSNANAHVAKESAGYAWHAQEARCEQASMAMPQMARCAAKAKKAKGFW